MANRWLDYMGSMEAAWKLLKPVFTLPVEKRHLTMGESLQILERLDALGRDVGVTMMKVAGATQEQIDQATAAADAAAAAARERRAGPSSMQ